MGWSPVADSRGVELCRPDDIPEQQIDGTIGTSPIACVLAFVLSLAAGVCAYELGWEPLRGLPGLAQTLLAPFVLIGGALWLLVSHALWQSMLGAFQAGNWILKVGPSDIYLNLRCYANYHLGDSGPTVVRIPHGEIESCGHLRERFETRHSEEHRFQSYLEIRLRHQDTDALREAVRAEAKLEAPMGRWTRSRGRSMLRPVVVTGPGVLRVAWRGRKMLRALEGVANLAAPREQHLARPGDQGRGTEVDDKILALVERGAHMQALELVQDAYNMSIAQAHTFLQELEGDGAAEPPTSASTSRRRSTDGDPSAGTAGRLPPPVNR